MKESLNVIMFHSVGSDKSDWCDKRLSISENQFEYFCKYLFKKKFKTYFLDRWYFLQDNVDKQNKKDCFLTFDDGYLDNLLVAYPILKKYNLKATLFINPGFVDPCRGIRNRDSDDMIRKGTNCTLGFLNWDEIKFLDSTDVFDVQSHSMSHDFYFKDRKIIDLYLGQDKYHWMTFMNNSAKKVWWQDGSLKKDVAFGTPVFSYGRSLGIKKYYPSQTIVKKAVSLYNQGVSKNNIIIGLKELLKEYPGRFETHQELIDRYSKELIESKSILEEKLNKKIDFLCWPGGAYNKIALDIFKKAGYKASTLSSKDSASFVSNQGKKYKRIKRFGLSPVLGICESKKIVLDYDFFVLMKFMCVRKNFFYLNLYRILKLCYVLGIARVKNVNKISV